MKIDPSKITRGTTGIADAANLPLFPTRQPSSIPIQQSKQSHNDDRKEEDAG
jgi:hypothetical protein